MIKEADFKWGNIKIEKPVAARIIREAVFSLGHSVSLCNSKGRPYAKRHLINFDKNSDYIRIIRISPDSYQISINILIRFGLSISEFSSTLIAKIRHDLTEYMDFSPDEIELRILGLRTKSKEIVKRNIVIKG